MIKIDPYLNVDAGTMSPFEHGETYQPYTLNPKSTFFTLINNLIWRHK